jgi:hypothetical protein
LLEFWSRDQIKPKVLIKPIPGFVKKSERLDPDIDSRDFGLHPKMPHPKLNKQTFTNNNGHWIPLTSSACSLPASSYLLSYPPIFNKL